MRMLNNEHTKTPSGNKACAFLGNKYYIAGLKSVVELNLSYAHTETQLTDALSRAVSEVHLIELFYYCTDPAPAAI